MKNQDEVRLKRDAVEQRFLERLRQHPELLSRFESILELAHNNDGPLKTADQVEELLVEELRQLGNVSMNQWAHRAGTRVSNELKASDDSVRSRKKKALTRWCVFGLVSVQDRVWGNAEQSYLRPLPARLGVSLEVGRGGWTGC